MNSRESLESLEPLITRRRRRTLAVAATTLMAIATTACAADTSSSPPVAVTSTAVMPDAVTAFGTVSSSTASSTASPSTAVDTGLVATAAAAVPADPSLLSADEIDGLSWMREEEQLAHDVYTFLGDLWGVRIFENIASSESSHIDAVTGLLDSYGIDDPASGNELGTFTNPAIQSLYDELVATGSESLDAALSVGALIEELDISDLQQRSDATERADITAVYADLERGSRNHLRAFTSPLEARGISYEPTRLDPETFDAIVSSAIERGRDG